MLPSRNEEEETLMSVCDVFAGFSKGKLRLTEVNECMTLRVECQGRIWKCLVDSGCDTNIIFAHVMEELEGDKEINPGIIQGIGNQIAKVKGRMILRLSVGGIKMKEASFHCLDGIHDKF